MSILRFLREIYSHWETAWLGTVSIIVALVLYFTGAKALTWGGFALAAFVCLALASFQVWDKKEKQIRNLKEVLGKTQILLRPNPEYTNETSKYLTVREFLIQTEGDRKAFGVRVSSEDAVGEDHGRLSVVWSVDSGIVGNDPVPVSVFCDWHKGNQGRSVVGSQIKAFMDQKVGGKELIATVRYTDLEGNPYEKRFRVFRERDGIGFCQTHCEPLPGHAAS